MTRPSFDKLQRLGMDFAPLAVVPLLMATLVAPFAQASIATTQPFADTAFQQIWQRTDGPVLSGKAQRSWYWGPVPGEQRREPFAEAKSGTRLVQYFDKARMEINNPDGDRSSAWFVTCGLLVAEMVKGKQQTAASTFIPMRPAEIAVAGDGLESDPDAPTYTSFRKVASTGAPGVNRASPHVGRFASSTIDRGGKTGENSALGLFPGSNIAAYIDEAGHNIPKAMWDFLNLKGVVQQGNTLREGQTLANWIYVMGYPITEPYWVRVKIGDVYNDVLVQLYERRALTYVPGAPKGWQVQMTNAGQHYYRWLHGGRLPEPAEGLVGAPAATGVPSPVLATMTSTSTGTQVAPVATKTALSPQPSPPVPLTTVTVPAVATEPASGILLGVQPGFGGPNTEFRFGVRGLIANEDVELQFTDPLGTTTRVLAPGGGLFHADELGEVRVDLIPARDLSSTPLGYWLFEIRGIQSRLEGVVGFTLR